MRVCCRSNLTAQQLQNATPSELTQTALDNVELTEVSGLFGESTSSDSVSLSQSMESALLGEPSSSNTSTTDPLLQALNTEMTNAGTAAIDGATAASSSSTTQSTAASAGTGSLFSYMG